MLIAPGMNRVQVTNNRPVSGSTVIHSLSCKPADEDWVDEVISYGPPQVAPPSVERWRLRLAKPLAGR